MARKKIPNPLPEEHVRKLARRLIDGQLSLFVGAGLSHLAPAKDGSDRRLPLWTGLTEQVAEACSQDAEVFSGDPLELFDAIVYEQERGTLERAIADALDDTAFDLAPAHRALGDLQWRAVVTSNYDGLLQRLLNEEPVVSEPDYDRRSAPEDQQPRLFQIHGTRVRPHTLTREDYRLWESKHPRAARHLYELLERGTILFVGYSLSDPHLDAILATVRQIAGARAKRLYAWMWRYPEQKIRLLDQRDKIEAISIDGEDQWEATFRQLGAAVEELLQKQEPAPEPAGADPFAYDRHQYLQAVRTRFGVANLQGLYVWGAGYARDDVALEEVFVEPDLLRQESGPRSGPDSAVPKTLRDLRWLREKVQEETGPLGGRISAFTLFQQEPRVLVVGAPGQGKSTLLRAWLLTAGERWAADPAGQPFPSLIRLADWERKAEAGEASLIDLVREGLPSLGEIGSIAAQNWLEGPVLWLLDGVDEVRDRYERERFREEVLAVAAQRPGDRWIVSTRPAGEPAGGWAVGWTRTELPSLTERQIEAVLAAWGRVLEAKEGLAIDTRELARNLKKDPGLRTVRGNGLLLTLAVLFYKARHRLPHDRWEFFEVAEQVLRDSWVHHRFRRAADHLPGGYLPELLERLALAGMQEGIVLFPRERLEQETANLLTERGYVGAERDREVARFLRAAEDLIGVLVSQGPDQFGFLHLTFQEFLAARELIHRSTEASKYIARYWDHPDWEQVWVLYALGAQSDPGRIAELHRTILTNGHGLDSVLERPRLKSLELGGVGSAPLPPEAQESLDWAIEIAGGKSRYSLRVRIWRVLANWERVLPEVVIKGILSALENEEEVLGTQILYVLESWSSEPAVRQALLTRLGHQDFAMRRPAAWALRSAASDQATRKTLLQCLDHVDAIVRSSAAAALGAVASEPEVRQALLQRLDDQDLEVSTDAAEALVSVTSEPEVRQAFLSRIGDPYGVGRAAVEGLRSVASDPAVRGTLLGYLKDPNPELRSNVAQVLTSVPNDPALGRVFLDLLDDTHYLVRWAAGEALASFVAEPEVRQALLDRLGEQDSTMRWIAADALSSVVSDPTVRDAVLKRLDDKVPAVRRRTAQVLASVASEPEVLRALLKRLSDRNSDVRATVAPILGSASSEAAVRKALLKRLSDPDSDVRWAVVGALGAVASDPAVTRALLERLGDEDLWVQLAAGEALARGIEQEKFSPK